MKNSFLKKSNKHELDSVHFQMSNNQCVNNPSLGTSNKELILILPQSPHIPLDYQGLFLLNTKIL